MAATPKQIGDIAETILQTIEAGSLTVSESKTALNLVHSVIDNRVAENGKDPWSAAGMSMDVNE
jgi:hypothetical protein